MDAKFEYLSMPNRAIEECAARTATLMDFEDLVALATAPEGQVQEFIEALRRKAQAVTAQR